MRIATIIALLLFSTALFAESRIEADLKAAKERVAKLEADLFAKEPLIKQAEAEYKRLKEHFNRENGRLANPALKYLQEQDAKSDGKATRDYKTLRDAWLSLHGARAANDPVQGPLLKAWILSEAQGRKKIAEMVFGRPPTPDETNDAEKLWEAYQALQSKSEPRLRARVEKLEKESGFSDDLLEFIRMGAQSKVTLDGVYFPYLQVKIPKELRDARAQVVELTREVEINRRD
jgi:hypothetical protein